MPPPAGFNVYAGTSARVKAGLVTPDLTVDLIASSAYSAVTPVTQSWVREWTIQTRVQSGKLATLESPGTAQGVIQPRSMRGGIAEYTVDIRGVLDADSSGDYATRYPIGGFLVADLLFSKSSNYGRHATPLKIIGHNEGNKYAADPDEFVINCEVDGALPAPAFS